MRSVFIIGPYGTGEDVAANVRNAMKSWHRLQVAGFAPICPHLNHFLHMNSPRPIDVWITQDNHWLRKCDCAFRLPGESVHGDDEQKLAESIGIPVFTSVVDVEAFWNSQPEA